MWCGQNHTMSYGWLEDVGNALGGNSSNYNLYHGSGIYRKYMDGDEELSSGQGRATSFYFIHWK